MSRDEAKSSGGCGDRIRTQNCDSKTENSPFSYRNQSQVGLEPSIFLHFFRPRRRDDLLAFLQRDTTLHNVTSVNSFRRLSERGVTAQGYR